MLLGQRDKQRYFSRIIGNALNEESNLVLRLEGLKNLKNKEGRHYLTIGMKLFDADTQEVLQEDKQLFSSPKGLSPSETSLLLIDIMKVDLKASARIYTLSLLLKDDLEEGDKSLEILYGFQVGAAGEDIKPAAIGIKSLNTPSGVETFEQGLSLKSFDVYQEGNKLNLPLNVKLGNRITVVLQKLNGIKEVKGKDGSECEIGISVLVVRNDGEEVFRVIDVFQNRSAPSKKVAENLDFEV